MNFFPFLMSFDGFNYEFVLEVFFRFLLYLMSNEVHNCISGRLNNFTTLEKDWAMVNHGSGQHIMDLRPKLYLSQALN